MKWLVVILMAWMAALPAPVVAQAVTPTLTAEQIDSINRQVVQLYQQGRYAQAVQVAQQSLAASEKLFGPDHASTAVSLNNLAHLFESMGRYDDALPLYRRALQIDENALGPEHASTAAIINNLAGFFRAIGRYDDALPLYRRALQINENALGPDHPNTATSINNLAGVFESMGRYDDALPLYRRALQIREKTLGPDHPSTATSLNNLAGVFESMGRYEDALPLYRRALQIREKSVGPEHASTATSLNNLAELFRTMGRYDDALPLYRRALQIDEKVLGVDHPDTAIDYNNLAGLFEAMGHYEDALPLYHHALQITEKALGPDHPSTATSLNNVASISKSMGRYDDALPLYRRALLIKEKALGPDHPSTATSLNNLALFFQSTGRYNDALPLHRRALQIREKALGPNHASTATSLNNLASLFESMGRYDDALPLYRRALQIQEIALGPDHPSTATSLNNLALFFQSTGRYNDALPLYRRALQIYENALGPDHPSTAISLNNLAGVFESMGRYNDALPLYRRALHIVMTSDITNPGGNHGAVEHLSKFSANLASFIVKHRPEQELDEAIFYYKLSVNTRQRMRAGTKGLDKSTRDSFTQTVADAYQELAKLLIQRGRLDEAERVLLMLKESDLYDFLRRSGSASDTSQEVLRWTADEDRLNQSLLKIARAWQTYNSDWHTLDEKQKRGEIKDDAPEFAQLAAQRQQIETQTDNQLNDALERFRDGLREMALNNQKSFEIARTTLAQKLSDIQQLSGTPSPRTAGLVLLPGKRGLTMVVTTELGAVPLMVPVDEDTLVKLVQELREALRTRGDYQTAAKALHQYLIAPAEQQLGQQAGIQQWAILPYGALRNLPFATLMNATGQHLIERYALVTLTADGEGGFSGLDTAPKTEWRSAGFGASIADSAFNNVALPGVRIELCGIVSDPSEAAECQAQTSGVIPGRRYLNAHFTSAKLNLLMGPPTSTQAPSLLHIATHFSIDKSMLLLGDGGTLTLEAIGQWKPRLGHYDLVALSACDSGKTEAGVESLGGLFRKLGAKSVLATLWPLADVGAGPLMVEFYRQRGAQRVMAKSEALRRAQLAMLRGELKNPDNPATDLRHPYYWAGYVLMGNWL